MKSNWVKFFEMEKEFDLFSLRSFEGLPFWDICRYYVYSNIESKNYLTINPSDRIVKTKESNTLASLLNFMKTLKAFKKNVFFVASREKTPEGKYFDRNAFDTIEHINEPQFIFETIRDNHNLVYHEYTYSFEGIFMALFSRIVKNRLISPRDKALIKKAISNKLGIVDFDIESLESVFQRFYYSYYYYRVIFGLCKPKRIFITQNSIQKGLFYAAKKRNIPVIEFQHGVIDKSHMAYSYNENINYSSTDLILPDKFLLYSEYWTEKIYIPFVEKIVLGNSILTREIKIENNNIITVISTTLHGTWLKELTKSLASKLKEYTFYYKLHTNEAIDKIHYIKYFEEFPNVHIISNEKNISDLISCSKAFLLVASTVVYEVLNYGRPVFIYNKPGHEIHDDILSYDGVYLINNELEFLDIELVQNKPTTNFFQKFNDTTLNEKVLLKK